MLEFFECVSYLARLGAFSFLIGRLIAKRDIPWDKYHLSFMSGEKEEEFFRLIKVGRWQKKIPDMSRLFFFIMPQKAITKDYKTQLPTMIKETYIAEVVHIGLMFFGFKCCRLWKGIGGLVLSLLFFFGNLPYVIVQRYNRPRLIRVYKRLNTDKKREKDHENTDIELQHRTRS